jgi:hypothetical protein
MAACGHGASNPAAATAPEPITNMPRIRTRARTQMGRQNSTKRFKQLLHQDTSFFIYRTLRVVMLIVIN